MSVRSLKIGWRHPTQLSSLGLTHQMPGIPRLPQSLREKKNQNTQDTFHFIWEQSSKTNPWGGIVLLKSHKSNFTSLYLKNEDVVSPQYMPQNHRSSLPRRRSQVSLGRARPGEHFPCARHCLKLFLDTNLIFTSIPGNPIIQLKLKHREVR